MFHRLRRGHLYLSRQLTGAGRDVHIGPRVLRSSNGEATQGQGISDNLQHAQFLWAQFMSRGPAQEGFCLLVLAHLCVTASAWAITRICAFRA